VHSKPTEARHGLLCVAHFDRLADMLRQIEEEAAILSAVPSMAIRTGSGGGSLASTRAPARLDVLVHLDTRRGTGKSETDDDQHAAGQDAARARRVALWARVVREERGFASRAAVTISGERDVLTRALDWIAEQPWVDEMYNEVTAARGAAQGGERASCGSAVQPLPQHRERQQLHRRGVATGRDAGGVAVYPDRCAQSWEQAPGAAVCDMCNAIWATDADKARLKRMVDDMAAELARPKTEDGRRMLTAQEMAAPGTTSSPTCGRWRAGRASALCVGTTTRTCSRARLRLAGHEKACHVAQRHDDVSFCTRATAFSGCGDPSSPQPRDFGPGLLCVWRAEDERHEAEKAALRQDREGFVYYLRVGERLKIGYSVDVKRRMRAYPPGSDLLAVEPGDRALETQRHRQFAGSRTDGREWFRPTPDILDLVGEIVGTYGEPRRFAHHYRRNQQPVQVRRAS
jgi:hypothetical protein